MKQRPRIYYTESQKALMWERWQKGESLQQIAQLFDRNHSSIQGDSGADRRDSSGATMPLPIGADVGRTGRDLARGGCGSFDPFDRSVNSAERHPRSVARSSATVARNATERVRPTRRPGIGHVAPRPVNWRRTERWRASWQSKLQVQWSPEQIAGWLKRTYPDDASRQVSHETIYRSLFIQARGALKKELVEHLRRTRVMRRSRHHTQKTDDHGRITDTVSISERPATVEDRAVPGHWEGDLLFGSKNSQIATLVERQTRYVMLVKVAGKDTETVINALIKNARKLPQELYKSLTWDRGKEMADHKRFTLATDIKVYFCDPQNPWQRGTNENTNGLLRQYFPKGTDLSGYSQAKLNAVARRLNERPRKTLNYETPAERFHQTVASIG